MLTAIVLKIAYQILNPNIMSISDVYSIKIHIIIILFKIYNTLLINLMAFNFSKVLFPPSAVGVIFTESGGGTNTVTINAPTSITSNYSLALPSADGSPGEVLTTNGVGILSWSAGGGGGGLSIDTIHVVSNKILVSNITDIIVGYFPWDNSAYTGVSSITCSLWYSNMAASSQDLIVSTFDGTNTSTITISAPAVDALATFAVTKPSADTTIEVRVRRGVGADPNPNVDGISFQLF